MHDACNILGLTKFLLVVPPDPVSDLLYTSNFALLGLHEAARATKNASYAEAENKLANFLVRIQAKSGQAAQPELDGAWFRAFDYHKWEVQQAVNFFHSSIIISQLGCVAQGVGQRRRSRLGGMVH